jgi:hypothetical protein
MGLRHFASGSDDALLEECLRGETTAIASYEHALARTDWSARSTFRTRVASQLTTIRSHARELEADLMMRIGSKNQGATLRRAKVSDARVAATINDDFAAWIDIRGIQLEGRAARVGSHCACGRDGKVVLTVSLSSRHRRRCRRRRCRIELRALQNHAFAIVARRS